MPAPSPIPILRHRRVRTAREIEQERTTLRIMRGDFEATSEGAAALRQVRGF